MKDYLLNDFKEELLLEQATTKQTFFIANCLIHLARLMSLKKHSIVAYRILDNAVDLLQKCSAEGNHKIKLKLEC